MRSFVIGSKKLSVSILQTLLDQGHEVLGVYTRDDEPGMRLWHTELGHPSLKDEAKALGIPCYEGMKVNSEASRELLRSLDLDVIFSCFWSELFREATLDIPKMGVFNLHTAYLPKNRGSRPIPWSMIRGDAFTGLTIHKMAPGVDNGPILSQVKVPISPSDTGKTLYEKVTRAGEELFRETLPNFHTLEQQLQPQDENAATYQPRGEPFGGQVNPYWTDERKARFRRAFHFPPFRAHREAPRPFMDHISARVYLVPGTLQATEYRLPYFALPRPLASMRRNDIGTPAERKALKSIFELLSDTSAIPKGCTITGPEPETGLEGMYAVHDVLQRTGVSFVVSQLYTTERWLQHFLFPQPFRYENGLLEIPAIMFNRTSDITPVLQQARSMAAGAGRDVFVPLILPDDTGCEAILKQLSEEIFNFGGNIISFPEVCTHFDTPYENIGT